MRVQYEDLLKKFQGILESRGFSGKHAKDAATVFANNSLDGVYSHGVNRFPRVVEYLDKGEIDSGAIATCESSMGAIERWNGHRVQHHAQHACLGRQGQKNRKQSIYHVHPQKQRETRCH